MISQLRITLLRLACLGIFLTLGKLVLNPEAGQRPFAVFSFPQTLSISGWQFVQGRPLSDRRSDVARYNRVLAGQQYHYQQAQNKRQLTIEMRYVVNTEGDILQLAKQQKSIGPNLSVTQSKTTLGIYSWFTVDHQIHLTSCINPRGDSTVTSEQFFRNRYSYDIHPAYLLSWILGQNDLLDKRCLWIDLSMSANAQTNKHAAAELEKIWRNQVVLWQLQFPQP